MTQIIQPTNRSDVIRKRRSNRVKKDYFSSTPRHSRKTRNSGRIPVVARGGFSGMPLQEYMQVKKARRRFDVALSTPGAEMRLPSIPFINLGWRLVSGTMGLVLAVCLYLIWNSPFYQVKEVEVNGLQRINSQDINAVAGISGKPVFIAEPNKIKESLENAFPELANISVQVRLPARVLVSVAERQPVLSWQQGDQLVWVDTSGVAFPPRGDHDPGLQVLAKDPFPTSPIEGGFSSQYSSVQFLPTDFVTAILVLGQYLPEGTSIIYTNDHGLGWHDSREWDVYFGTDVKNIESKLQIYNTLVHRLVKKEITPEFVSVEFVHAPYYRTRQ